MTGDQDSNCSVVCGFTTQNKEQPSFSRVQYIKRSYTKERSRQRILSTGCCWRRNFQLRTAFTPRSIQTSKDVRSIIGIEFNERILSFSRLFTLYVPHVPFHNSYRSFPAGYSYLVDRRRTADATASTIRFMNSMFSMDSMRVSSQNSL